MGFSGSNVVLVLASRLPYPPKRREGEEKRVRERGYLLLPIPILPSSQLRQVNNGEAHHPSFSAGINLCFRAFVDKHMGFNLGMMVSGSYFSMRSC
jgi:hypothetical protein